jgi:hypothetical protein
MISPDTKKRPIISGGTKLYAQFARIRNSSPGGMLSSDICAYSIQVSTSLVADRVVGVGISYIISTVEFVF